MTQSDDPSIPDKHEGLQILKVMKLNASPGPDGFNGTFLIKCWDFIKQDFYTMIWDFFEGNCDIQSINTAFITLIPKIANPENMNDFKTIIGQSSTQNYYQTFGQQSSEDHHYCYPPELVWVY